MIKLKVKVSILTWMELDTQESGKKTSSMEKARRPGLMEQCMKETTCMERNMEKENSDGQMDLSILVNS